ncbi:TniQ family protein [Burkholderia contaminans]|uniref:TniQ family protein n=1 Tax=Burkholderia contaminans TaxID=488447 RepID=UPI00158CE549|nr:TniQ family protein [Burkholderia contaminans]
MKLLDLKEMNSVARNCELVSRQNFIETWRSVHIGESLYSKWSRLCMATSMEFSECKRLFFGVGGNERLFPSVCPVDLESVDKYSKLISILNIDANELFYAFGCDLFPHKFRGKLISANFRYCHKCLANGFHSIVYQHVAVEYCPYHECLLNTACPKCRFEFCPTWHSTTNHPFACPRCGMLLVQTAVTIDGNHEIESASKKIECIRKMITSGADDKSIHHPYSRSEIWEPKRHEVASAARRHLWRHLDWKSEVVRDVDLRSKIFKLNNCENNYGHLHREVSDSICEALRRLSRLIDFESSALSRAMYNIAVKNNGARLCVDAALPHIAIAKSKYIYGVTPLIRFDEVVGNDPLNYGPTLLTMRSALIEQSVEASKILAEYEVVGLFCAILMHANRIEALRDMDWREVPNHNKYIPTWCYFKESRTLIVRPRADWRLAERLTARFMKKIVRG